MQKLDDILGSIGRIIGFICLFFVPIIGLLHTYVIIVEAIDDKVDFYLQNIRKLLYFIFLIIMFSFHISYLYWVIL